ncbi:MAG TPA: outer membrane protein assembly factor BamA [Thermoanaerobaculia bacterium]|nr:outer membrane protein assembly factor BamA [Thermoanaerobaculia bacterium]
MMPDFAELIVGRLNLHSLHQSQGPHGPHSLHGGHSCRGGSRLIRRAAALALLPLLLLNVPGGLPLRAQEPPYDANGKKIAALEFKGLKTLSEETLLFYLGLQVGQPFDAERLNGNIKTLWNRGLVDDVKVEAAPANPAEPATSGVRLTITVQERPVLRSIDYEGLKRLSKTDIQDKIATQHIRVHEGEPMSLGELQRIKALIEDLYREKGYRFAQARYSVQDLTGNEKRVVFSVDEGDRVRISEIRFAGNKVFANRRLRWAMKKTKETNWVTRVMKKDIYDPAKLQEDLDKVRELYRGDGYKNVVIGDPKIEVRAEKPNAAQAKDQKRRMIVEIPIEEGERWKFGQVTIEGNKIYPDKALLRSFEHKPGNWLRAKEIEEGIKRINDLYHNTGYIFARVDQELVERPEHVADLVIHVNESDQFKVGRIEFKGNDRTMDKVLRREVRLFEGGLVNIAAVRNSVLKINQLGYFKLDEEDPVDIDTNSEKKEVSLMFKGKESTRTEVQFGGGWSELDGFFGQFSLNTKNFLGRGEQLGASVQAGARRNLYDLSYYIPWFLDRPQTVGIRAFDSRLNYLALSSNYLQNAKGVVLSYGRNLGLFNSASISYTFSKRNDQLTNQLTNALDTFKIDTSSVRPAYVYDSRDNPFEPVRGKRYSLSLEYAGGVLGGNNNFLRPDLGFSLFQPLGSYPTHMVLAVNGEVGLLHPTNKVPLSPLEYFFLGGENSIRGHRFRSIVVRDRQGNPVLDALGNGTGGDKFVQLNLEYHFLLGGPFRLLPFVDMANVYGPGQSINLSKLRYTTGLELRITLPVFGAPLRFIYSHNLKPLPKDEFETFQFSIGTSF